MFGHRVWRRVVHDHYLNSPDSHSGSATSAETNCRTSGQCVVVDDDDRQPRSLDDQNRSLLALRIIHAEILITTPAENRPLS